MLIDAGVPGTPRQPLAEQLVGALQAAIPAGNKLAAILGGWRRTQACACHSDPLALATQPLWHGARHLSLCCAWCEPLSPMFDCPRPLAVSHHHPDHIGALPLLLAAYPDASVAFHEKEQPFLVGDENLVQPGSVEARVLRWAGLLGTAPVKASAGAWGVPHRRFGTSSVVLRPTRWASARCCACAATTRRPWPLLPACNATGCARRSPPPPSCSAPGAC